MNEGSITTNLISMNCSVGYDIEKTITDIRPIPYEPPSLPQKTRRWVFFIVVVRVRAAALDAAWYCAMLLIMLCSF